MGAEASVGLKWSYDRGNAPDIVPHGELEIKEHELSKELVRSNNATWVYVSFALVSFSPLLLILC
jgi:hypothetical protein